MARIVGRQVVGVRYSEELGADVEVERSILECDCGRHITLYNALTNTCDCGAEYNMSGQRLASRSQWGEETGESDADCDRADADIAARRDVFDGA